MKNICVIGAGRWGLNHIKTLDHLGALKGVVELDSEKRAKIKSSYPKVSVFSELVDSFKIKFDGYVIATPVTSHFEIAKTIINRKVSVLIEKPMTLNSEEARQIVELSKLNKVNVMVGHVLLFHPAIQKIKELILNKKIGKLQYIYSNRLNLGQVRTEENVFWSFAPHDISILQFLIDSYPTSINTFGGSFLQTGVDDTTITTLSYPQNIKAHIYVSWLHPFKEHRIVVIGSKGMISFEDSSSNKPLKFYDKKFIIKDSIPEKLDGKVTLINYPDKAPLTEELKYFIKNIDEKSVEIAGSQNGLDVIKILELSSSNSTYWSQSE